MYRRICRKFIVLGMSPSELIRPSFTVKNIYGKSFYELIVYCQYFTLFAGYTFVLVSSKRFISYHRDFSNHRIEWTIEMLDGQGFIYTIYMAYICHVNSKEK